MEKVLPEKQRQSRKFFPIVEISQTLNRLLKKGLRKPHLLKKVDENFYHNKRGTSVSIS